MYLSVDCLLWYNKNILKRECPVLDAPQKEVNAMPKKTEAQKRAQKSYMEKFVRVEIRMPPEQRNTIQSHAEARSESVNGFINRAISETMERDGGGTASKIAQQAAGMAQGAGVVSLPSEALEAAQRAADTAGERLPQFLARAVEAQVERDKVARGLKA